MPNSDLRAAVPHPPSADAQTAQADAPAEPAASADLTDLAHRVIALLPERGRIVVGIAGSPGAGKTTLAMNVAARINELLGSAETAVHLPMDGFHLANATLDRLGRHDRKGAIDTFDGWGFVALLRRLLVETDHTVYAPSFDRRVDEGIAAEIAVQPSARVVMVEGNYLLADTEPWREIAGLLAEAWFCETSEAERLRRLVDRHERHGRNPEAALAWAESVDGKNALLIEATRARATLTISGQ
ncbi:nucleoside/nucleotide kinase family protein [Cryobacterium glaciale]|uniref:Nucleoside/nucleotide kinase family protein n=1 Tax=Cryobacterium glaciale TaxID=1259145 RepID=A0A4R8UV12_9MICO|nr:nucleoside/nucleotide kinase family protein [Cryobacterium glaciale]TFB71863.1 nucleoside/nucleotide kinase family protein [Cryobacterium glaciale]